MSAMDDQDRPNEEQPNEIPGAVAIIGMAGRWPGAASVGEFWRNLVGGVE